MFKKYLIFLYLLVVFLLFVSFNSVKAEDGCTTIGCIGGVHYSCDSGMNQQSITCPSGCLTSLVCDYNSTGVCGPANGTAMTYLWGAPGLCTAYCGSIYMEDSFGTDGTFNWRCLGSSPEGVCTNLASQYTARCASTKVVCNSDSDCGTCEKCASPGTTSSNCYDATTTGAAGVCGTANGSSFCVAPTTDLCSTGSLNTSWNGGWSWNCKGVDSGSCENRGATSPTCTATLKSAKGASGVCATLDPACTLPAEGSASLCSGTNYGSIVTDSTGVGGDFNWTCKGEPKGTTYCADGDSSIGCTATKNVLNTTCGAANRTCTNSGIANNFRSETRADGVYSIWDCVSSCNGTGENNCDLLVTPATYGVCGTADSAINPVCLFTQTSVGTSRCTTGDYSMVDDIATDWQFDWKCLGKNSNPLIDDTCSAPKLNIGGTDAVCKNIGPVCSLPPITVNNLCNYGTGVSVTDSNRTNGGDGFFNWICRGQTADPNICRSVGSDIGCSAPIKVTNAECGSSGDGVGDDNFKYEPTDFLCSVGTTTSTGVDPVIVATYPKWSWKCALDCNGTEASCLAVRDIEPTFPDIVTPTPTPTPTGPVTGTPTPTPYIITTEPEITIDGARLHNCQFTDDPNKVNISFEVTDSNGFSDIGLVSMRFKGLATVYPGTLVPTGDPKTVKVVFDNIDVSAMNGDYKIEAKADDIHSPYTSGWVELDFVFKKWDCQVSVNGTFYDSSAEEFFTCNVGNTVGFGTTAPSGLPFRINYVTSDSKVKSMSNNSPYFNDPEKLIWQDTYEANIFAFPGKLTTSKIGNSNNSCLTWENPFSVFKYVDAWSTSPTIDIKYSAVMDQEAWYRILDGNLIAQTKVVNRVPVTCKIDCSTTINGFIWSRQIDSSVRNGINITTDQPQPPLKNYYQSLKEEIKDQKNIGVVFDSSKKWSEIGVGTTGVVFVNGDLTIDDDVNPSSYVFFIVNGNITIEESVDLIKGVFYAENDITAIGVSSNQLKIIGSIYGKNRVELSRSFDPKSGNNITPATEIIYDPNLIFKFPKVLWRGFENWALD